MTGFVVQGQKYCIYATFKKEIRQFFDQSPLCLIDSQNSNSVKYYNLKEQFFILRFFYVIKKKSHSCDGKAEYFSFSSLYCHMIVQKSFS